MKTITEMEIKVTGGRIVGIGLSANGSCKISVEVEVETEQKPQDTSALLFEESNPGYCDVD